MARVKGRKSNREAIAIIIGHNGSPQPVLSEFDVNQTQRTHAKKVTALLEKTIIDQRITDPNVVLAAIASLAAKFITPLDTEEQQ